MGTLETTSSDQRSAVDKAFCLLKSFTPEDGGGVGVSELARRAHLSKSTAHRLLATLVANGAVQRAGGLYRLGSFFDELHSQSITPRHELVSEVLTPFLAALFERTRSTVHLAYLEGTQVVYANKLFSVRGISAPSRIGGRVPAYCTGVGKAILAYDEDLTERAIAEGLPKWTEHTLSDPDEFRRVLGQVREEGLAYDREENTVGLSCVAVPIFARDHIPVAAMSVSGPTESFHPQDYIPAMRKISAAASRAYIARMDRDSSLT